MSGLYCSAKRSKSSIFPPILERRASRKFPGNFNVQAGQNFVYFVKSDFDQKNKVPFFSLRFLSRKSEIF